MDGSIVLGRGQRNRLLDLYRKDPSPCVRLRAHIVLLLSDGHAWALIGAVLFCSTATVARWKARFGVGGVGGVGALADERPAGAAGDPAPRVGGAGRRAGPGAGAAGLRVLPEPVVPRH